MKEEEQYRVCVFVCVSKRVQKKKKIKNINHLKVVPYSATCLEYLTCISQLIDLSFSWSEHYVIDSPLTVAMLGKDNIVKLHL